MQSAQYLEGDNYYTNENTKSNECETEMHSPNSEPKEFIDEESLREQLNKTEEEITTLRQVLNVKLKLAQDLKRQLGITAINEMKGDIIHGINTIKESNTFKATTVVMKNVKEKTSSTLSTASSKFSQKLGMLRNTNTFKSIEGKMGTAYTSVKKVPCKYNPGDKIFAKVKGFVYWPARVNPLPDDIVVPPNKIPIFFYGTHEVFFISPTSCWPYDEKNKSKWGKPRSRAYFNQGMDEIENHATIYQYGVDPAAEDFLSQFYQFKKSNGQNSTPNKLRKQDNEVENDEEEEDMSKEESIKSKQSSDREIIKQSTASKKRNKSGSSISMKENKNHSTKSNAMTELSISDVKSEETNDIIELSQSIAPPKKRQRSGSAMSAKENTNCEAATVNDMEISNALIQDSGVTTRKRQTSDVNELAIINNSSKLNKPRAVSRKRQRNNVKEKLELKTEINLNDEKSKTSIDCEITSKWLEGRKQEKDDQTCILECMTNSVVKLENNLDNKLIMEMLKKDAADVDKLSMKSGQSHQSDNSKNIKTSTRCRNKSSGNKTSNSKSDMEKNSEKESDSLSIDSDNPEDEDFRPAPKVKRLTKKIKSPKQPKVIAKKSVSSQSKRASKTKTSTKKKTALKVASDDSLSSLSSVEDWKAIDEKQKKESEEKLKSIQIQRLQLEEMTVKETNKKAKEKLIPDSLTVENEEIENKILKHEILDKNKEKSPEQIVVKENENIGTKLDKEILVNILKTDLISENQKEEAIAKDIPELVSGDKDSKKSSEFCEMPNEKVIRNRKEKGKKSMVLTDSDIDAVELSNEVSVKVIESTNSPQEKISKVKINLKEMKVSKTKGKPKPPPSRKRNRKLSSSDSDFEIKKEESKPKPKKTKILEKSSESDDNAKNEFKINDKTSWDKLQILQNFNADIRSSLILGHEDYKTCLERFKSLCEMEIDLVSLVKVWQLMDTVKKCRRYKRNEQVKHEAQAVYKRFMDIYSQASKDEIAMAQSLLVQYRHQNNVQNQNVGNESHKTNGGLTVPISVADMFQNKLSYQFESHSSKLNINHNKDELINSKQASATVAASTTDVSELYKSRVTPTEEEINEEKMRLLSVDLEAKVSDILNKIEKNVDVMNQKSLSHLLPSTDENLAIKLPTQWKSMNEKSVDKEKYVDDDYSDEDEDVEAIVRRIEEVAIKLPDPEPLSDDITNINGMGNSSALDARIENLFNNSFISSSTVSTKDVRQKKSRISSRHNKPSAKSISPLRAVTNQKLDQQEPVVIKTSEIETSTVVPPVLSLLQDQKDDIEIYDLLGV